MATGGATPSRDIAGERPTMFLRKASGVVKAFSPLDSFIYNSLANNPLTLAPMTLILLAAFFPGGNIPLGVILAGIFIAVGGVVYAMLQAAMPRSGGDYIFQSRILGGSVGFILTFTAYVIIDGLWLGLNGWLATNLILGPMFTLLGGYWNVAWMTDFATWLVAPFGTFLVGAILTTWIAFMCSIGFTTYARIQRWPFWIGLALTAFLFVFMALFTQDGFIASFNAFMSQNFGVADAYNTTIANATAAGWSPSSGFDLGQTFMTMPSILFILLWALWGAGNAGEIRDRGTVNTKLWQILGSLVFTAAITAILGYLVVSRFGSDFLSASAYLYYNAPDQTVLPFAPFFGFFTAALTTNPILTILVFVGIYMWAIGAQPNAMVYASRVVLAMSMDRALPAWFGKVNSRTHTPLNAVLSIAALGILFNALYSFTDWFWKLTLSTTLMALISYSVTIFAAAIWPYTKPQLFNASPIAKYKLGGVPAVTICGALFVLGALWFLWQFATVGAYGVASDTGYYFNVGFMALGALIYFVAKAYRKRRESLDLGLLYKEIPPE